MLRYAQHDNSEVIIRIWYNTLRPFPNIGGLPQKASCFLLPMGAGAEALWEFAPIRA
jgi:hypothetical protein